MLRLLLIFLTFSTFSFGQTDWYYELVENPPFVGPFEISPIYGVRIQPKVQLEDNQYRMFSGEIGISGIAGYQGFKGGNCLFCGNSDWWYVGPFVSAEFRTISDTLEGNKVNMKQFVSPVMLNGGLQFGVGDTYEFPVGIGGIFAVCNDFDDWYGRIGIGIDLIDFNLGIGGYFPLKSYPSRPNYMQGIFIDARFTLWQGE